MSSNTVNTQKKMKDAADMDRMSTDSVVRHFVRRKRLQRSAKKSTKIFWFK